MVCSRAMQEYCRGTKTVSYREVVNAVFAGAKNCEPQNNRELSSWYG